MENHLRKLLRPLLQGPLLRARLTQLSSRLSRAYTKMLTDRLSKRLPAAPVRPPGSPLRKILFVCDNMWERRELLPELQRICSVTFLDVGIFKNLTDSGTGYELKLSRLMPVLDALKDIDFDTIIVYLNASLLTEEIIARLRRWPCPLIGMNLDDKTTYDNYGVFFRGTDGYRKYAGQFDMNLTNTRVVLDVYRTDGFRALYLPTGFHCDRERPVDPAAAVYSHRLSFVGSRKPERAQFIAALSERGIQVDLFGAGWGGAGYSNDGREIYRKSQLNLGLGYNLPGTQFTNLKNRDFECPGAGGCYLTTFDWELAELFDVGKEILCYRNLEECIEVYAYYVRRPERCREIALAGQRRAVHEHTWERRFREVFLEMGLKAES